MYVKLKTGDKGEGQAKMGHGLTVPWVLQLV